MSGADPAGGEDVIEGSPHLVDGGHDDPGIVGDHPRFPQPDADLVQSLREEAEIGVLGAPGQDLVADDQYTGGDDFWLAGRGPLLSLPADDVTSHRQMYRLAQSARPRRLEDCRAARQRLP